MHVSLENTAALERRLTVEIPEAEIQQAVDSRLKDLSKKVKIKGFRPGRVPMSVIRQRYGMQVRYEVSNETMQKSLQQAIREQNLRPASMPRLDNPPEGVEKGNLRFTALVEVFPEIGPIDVSGLALETPQAEVTDQDVEEMLQTLREQRRSWNPVERAPQPGDHVLFEYVAQTEQGRVPATGHQRLAIVIGSSGFDQLESVLSGMRAGDSRQADIEFPAAFREPDLAGKKATVDIKVTTVSESLVPEVDGDFIRGFGIEDGSIESMHREIRGNLERELKQATTSVVKVLIVDALLAASPDIEVPQSMVRQQATSLAEQVARQEGRDPDAEDVTRLMGKAADRVRGGLLMGAIARQAGIRTDPARVRRAIETVANTYEEPTEIIQLYYSKQELMGQVENAVLEEQVVDWVLENAKVTAREIKFQDVIAQAVSAGQ